MCNLIEKLFDIMEEKHEISHDDIEQISKELGISKNEINAVISFYQEFSLKKLDNQIYVCMGISCIERGAEQLYENLLKKGYKVKKSYCFKKCAQPPVIKINDKFILQANHLVDKEIINEQIQNLQKQIIPKNPYPKIKIKRCIAGNCLHHKVDIDPNYFEIENVGCLGYCGKAPVGIINNKIYTLKKDLLKTIMDDISKLKSFDHYVFDKEQKIITKFNDEIDPWDIDSFIKVGGFEGLKKALMMSKEEIIDIANRAGIRGKGGAAFPLYIKLKSVSVQKECPKYVVANLEEGEISSYCNIILAESNPFIIVEGMAIAAHVVGASKGFIFVNYKAKEAIERLKNAVKLAKEKGFIDNEKFRFDIEIRRSPSAYIAGEETAMLEVIEGKKAYPRNRPPFPFQYGLFGKPTLINNVETLAALACAVNYGPEVFEKFGTTQSKGTKIISLAGNVNNPCVTEVPYGIKIKEIIEKYGMGFRIENKGFLLGGPSGGILDNSALDLYYTYEDIAKTGAMLGSGAIFAIPISMSIPKLVRDLMQFFADESCGQCIPCRVGTVKLVELLDSFRKDGKLDEAVKEISNTVKNASLCGLGQAAPIPLLTALENFPQEFNIISEYNNE